MAETENRETPPRNPLDNHRAAVSAALDADKRMRFRIGLAVAALGFLLLVIVVVSAIHSSSPEPSYPTVSAQGFDKPAESAPRPSAGAIAPPPPAEVVSKATSEDRELREDGRVYSVALIVATTDISPGAKLFAQGRVLSFNYADGMLSRRFAIIADEEEHGKTLMCAMTGGEGKDVFSLYHVGEVVAVSGEYLDTAGFNGYPRVALTNCHVADRQDNVVRPAAIPAPQLAGDYGPLPVQRATVPLPDTSAEPSRTTPSAGATTQSHPALTFDSGVRLYVDVIYVSHQPDGSFTFLGKLLLPVALAGGGSVDKGAKVIGAGITSIDHPGHVTVTVKGFTVGGSKYALQTESGGQAGTGPGIESSTNRVKSLEMWFSSASVYQETTNLEATADQ